MTAWTLAQRLWLRVRYRVDRTEEPACCRRPPRKNRSIKPGKNLPPREVRLSAHACTTSDYVDDEKVPAFRSGVGTDRAHLRGMRRAPFPYHAGRSFARSARQTESGASLSRPGPRGLTRAPVRIGPGATPRSAAGGDPGACTSTLPTPAGSEPTEEAVWVRALQPARTRGGKPVDQPAQAPAFVSQVPLIRHPHLRHRRRVPTDRRVVSERQPLHDRPMIRPRSTHFGRSPRAPSPSRRSSTPPPVPRSSCPTAAALSWRFFMPKACRR